MPDANGRPMPGEPGYDEYQKAMGGYGNQSSAAAELARHIDPSAQGLYVEGSQYGSPMVKSSNPPAPPPGAGQGTPQAQNYLEDLWKQYGSAFFGPTNQDQLLPGLEQQLANPGEAEQFYQRALNTDTDPYYQRLQKQGEDALNQQMAARGHYNSGAAIAGLGNFTSGLKAQQYHDLGTYAQAAQQGQEARIGLGSQIAGATDASDTARLTAGFGVAGQAQNLNQDAIKTYLGAQTGLDTQTQKVILDAFGKGGDLASEAGRSAIEAQVKAALAQAGGSQAQQDAAMKAIEAVIAAL